MYTSYPEDFIFVITSDVQNKMNFISKNQHSTKFKQIISKPPQTQTYHQIRNGQGMICFKK